MLSPQPGRTYIMETSDGRTIIFTFVNVGHYRVAGEDKFVQSFSDLAAPYAIKTWPVEYHG
ncbi:hypothetical protein B0G82_7940 [Paraburkholderia sp. BL17N1]|nr:hypothetical protein B0G82_7940 [Paraburkholderia sp. BL17N1]